MSITIALDMLRCCLLLCLFVFYVFGAEVTWTCTAAEDVTQPMESVWTTTFGGLPAIAGPLGGGFPEQTTWLRLSECGFTSNDIPGIGSFSPPNYHFQMDL